MSSKKESISNRFGIIHLANPDLTYIRNPEREQNYVSTLPPLRNLNQKS
jgi:hypothetical protein